MRRLSYLISRTSSTCENNDSRYTLMTFPPYLQQTLMATCKVCHNVAYSSAT